MQDIYSAEDGDLARVAAKTFADAYGAKFPKSVAKIVEDLDVLLEFYNYSAEHCVHMRTTNDGVDVLHRPAPHEGHEGARFPRRWAGDGAQSRASSAHTTRR